MTDLSRIPVLEINSSYEPTSIITAKRAFTLITKGAAVVEVPSRLTVRTARMSLSVPSVIRILRYHRIPRRTRSVSRRQILVRDRHQCQYCGSSPGTFKLTLDHVIPRSRGGPSSWENLVAACTPCNNRKSDRTPQEAGMKLLHKPLPHTVFSHRFIMREAAADNPDWQRFLFYQNTTPQAEVLD